MPAYTITLTKKEMVAKNTMAFHFEKPEGFTYIAGQYGDFTLINPPETDAEGNKRTFSFASAPYESDLMIVTRLRDTAFKRVLRDLPLGSELKLEAPFGSLALPKNEAKPAVFLTGGIGATLVRSMVTQAAHDHSPHKLTFFYANHAQEDAVFMPSFDALSRDGLLTFVPTFTDDADPQWSGERGLITIDMLKKYIPDLYAPVYYLSGPGDMVGDMRRLLQSAGVDRTAIRSDQFVGYN